MNLKQLLQGKIRGNNKFPFAETRDTACIICNHILNGEKPILFVSHDEDDGMWQFLCGGSHGMEDAKVVALGEVFDLDPSIGKVAEMPCGYCATRDKVDSDWVVKNENNDKKANGWDAITELCDEIYPDQKNPKHYGTLISWELGGNDPLRGISVYDGGDYWHFITYGLSELYEKESDIKDVSGYGMEFTFKLKKDNYENEENEIKCICGILQSIARITFTKGEIFNNYEYLYTGQTEGIDCSGKSNITGFITVPDDKFHEINTPNGRVSFVELIGVTDNELKAIRNKQISVRELYEKIGSDVTNYNRKSVM